MIKSPKSAAITIWILALAITSGGAFAATTDNIIIYSLGFLRLNAQATAAVKGQLSLVSPTNLETGWQIYSSPELAKIVIANQQEITAQLKGVRTNRQDSLLYHSWLASANTEPISVRLEESIFTGTEYVDKLLTNFELSLAPLTVNRDSREVLTQVGLRYQSPAGEFSEASSTVWLSRQAANPIMLVAKNISGSEQSETEFFALCAGASIIPATELLASGPVLSYGDIEGIREFVSTRFEPTPRHDMKIGLLYSNPKIAVSARIDRFFGDRHCYLALNNEQTAAHASLGFDLPIQSTLRFATNFKTSHKDSADFTLRSGLLDKTVLGKLQLEAVCYFININLDDKMVLNYPHLELSAAFSQPRWSLWYTGEFATGFYSQRSGIDVLLTSHLTLQASYCFEEEKARKYTLGLFYRFTK